MGAHLKGQLLVGHDASQLDAEGRLGELVQNQHGSIPQGMVVFMQECAPENTTGLPSGHRGPARRASPCRSQCIAMPRPGTQGQSGHRSITWGGVRVGHGVEDDGPAGAGLLRAAMDTAPRASHDPGAGALAGGAARLALWRQSGILLRRSEEHTSELQSRGHLVCRLLLETKKKFSMTIFIFYRMYLI